MSTELAKLRRIVERADLATAIIEMDGAFATSEEVHYAPGRECSADQRRPSNSLAGFNLIGEGVRGLPAYLCVFFPFSGTRVHPHGSGPTAGRRAPACGPCGRDESDHLPRRAGRYGLLPVRRPRLKRKAGARDGGVGESVTSYEDRDSDRKIAYPDYERESGTKWPDKHLDPEEAQLFAFAALRALDGAGFDIVPKKDKPDADRP